MPRKRHLTDAEKMAIWRYHKEHPLVTHTDVGAFFGVERSTVSKIVHQDHYQDPTDDSGYSSPDTATRPQPNYKAQCALVEYQESSDRRGLSVTRAMMRKKAAIVAAKSWLEQNQQGTHAAATEEGSCGESHSAGGTLPIDGTILSTDVALGVTEADNVDGWVQSELAHDQAGIPGGNLELFPERSVYSNEWGHGNELTDYMTATSSTQETFPLQEFVQPNKEGSLHMEAIKALNVLSQQLAQRWPLCSAAGNMINLVQTTSESSDWTSFEWQRRLERLGNPRRSLSASSSDSLESICDMAELTDKGRRTTFSLGQRLRHLYVHQLGFLPDTLNRAETIYLRSSPFPRALHSVQQAFAGLYPSNKRAKLLPRPAIVMRILREETLVPHEDNCQRFMQLTKAFSRTAEKWNKTPDVDYLNSLLQKHMPAGQRVAVDSTPSLHGIWDTINATRASDNPRFRLPHAFYDARTLEIIESIVLEEEYVGYKESKEYRTLGIGALLGEVVHSMRNSIQGMAVKATGASGPKLALAGCHDSTLAAVLAYLGALEGENAKWPPFTSSLAIELFRDEVDTPVSPQKQEEQGPSSPWLYKPSGPSDSDASADLPPSNPSNKINLSNPAHTTAYVRLRYNDRPVSIPGCALPGNHLPSDPTFCIFVAFRDIVAKFAPQDWKVACVSNLDKSAFPEGQEAAG